MRRQTLFTSDLHFGHDNILKFCDRPWDTVEEMDAGLIKRWNSKVKPNDLVYILGDFIWNSVGKERYADIMSQLNGEKILIIGNHDKMTPIQAINLGFRCAINECKIKIGKEMVTLSHYPYAPTFWRQAKGWIFRKLRIYKFDLRFLDRRPKDTGGWLLHGHDHRTDSVRDKSINIGVDANDFYPVSVNQIINIMRNNH